MNSLWKKSYCELCQNSSCSDQGKRNIHFMDHNHCSRFSDGTTTNSFILIPDGTYEDDEGNTKLIESFYISKYLVTVKEFHDYDFLPYMEEDANKPITSINWIQATGYCKDMGYRLPTVDEWEYACGDNISFNNIDNYAWYHDNSNRSQKIGLKKPNSFGLYDMLGNVWEFTSTNYDDQYIIAKGGSYIDDKYNCTVHSYLIVHKMDLYDCVGFRLVKDIK